MKYRIPGRYRRAAQLSVLVVGLAAATTGTWTSAPGPAARPSDTVVARQDATSSPAPTHSPTSRPAKGTLAYYLAQIPQFPPPPPPVNLALTHARGEAAFQYAIPTTSKVAFLTIDDGMVRHPWALPLMQAAKIPVTLFLTTNIIRGHIEYFRALQQAGAVIESHTITHPQLTSLSYERQKRELCHAADELGGWFGRRPVLFRPPFGDKNEDTVRAAWSCGLVAGFNWREAARNRHVAYQRPDNRIHAGDIILMHFRDTFPDDFVASLRAIKAAGLTPALLEDYGKV